MKTKKTNFKGNTREKNIQHKVAKQNFVENIENIRGKQKISKIKF